MRVIRTVIIDDEPLAREGVRMLLEEDSEVSVVAECANGREALAAISEKEPDLIFLDVQMPEMSGFEVLEAVGAERAPQVIFVTAYNKYALQAFEAHALDYLLKPFTVKRFNEALGRAKTQIQNEQNGALNRRLATLLEDLKPQAKYLERIVVKNSGRVSFLSVEEISWIEAAESYVRFHVEGGKSYLIRGAISRLEAQLDPARFLRIHRSIIVSIKQIKEMQPLFHGDYEIVVKDGTKLNSSRSYRDKLQRLLENSF
jgi:two-component system, LytTR family, response regulator